MPPRRSSFRVGDRVVTIRMFKGKPFFRVGEFRGYRRPDDGSEYDKGKLAQAKIVFKDGTVVWGHQCWWGRPGDAKRFEDEWRHQK